MVILASLSPLLFKLLAFWRSLPSKPSGPLSASGLRGPQDIIYVCLFCRWYTYAYVYTSALSCTLILDSGNTMYMHRFTPICTAATFWLGYDTYNMLENTRSYQYCHSNEYRVNLAIVQKPDFVRQNRSQPENIYNVPCTYCTIIRGRDYLRTIWCERYLLHFVFMSQKFS